MPNKDCQSLRNCPFCGGEAEMAKHFLYGKVAGYHVFCKKCDCEIKLYKTKGNARNAWNRRVNDEQRKEDGE